MTLRAVGASVIAVLITLTLSPVAQAAPPTVPQPGVDYLTVRGTWFSVLKNTPSRGLTTERQVVAFLTTGTVSGEKQNSTATRSEVCLDIQDNVTDKAGNSVTDPDKQFPVDSGCAPLATTAIAPDLSSARVAPTQMELTHSYFVCPPDGTFDCQQVNEPGPTVTFAATWTATTPLESQTLCFKEGHVVSTDTFRDGAATATLNGRSAGSNIPGDVYTWFLHHTAEQASC
jgi:hypothetical protein